MKDTVIESKVTMLKDLVDNINILMKELQHLNVEVRIAYVDKNTDKDINQSIKVWRIEERNDYL